MAEVDAVELNFANAITLTLLAGGTGDFTVGETVTGGTSNTTADVKSWDSATGKLIVINRDGRFTIPETITGDVSSASWTTANYNTLNNVNTDDTVDNNWTIETQADSILDFTEVNPFGEFGNSGGTL